MVYKSLNFSYLIIIMQICTICLNNIIIGVKTCCDHKFHKTCLFSWFKSQSTRSCPVCRFIFDFNNKPISAMLSICEPVDLTVKTYDVKRELIQIRILFIYFTGNLIIE